MPPSRSSKYRQFSTVLWKNLLLQTRSRGCCGLGGWAGFLLNIVLPAGVVFLLFCMFQIIEFPPLRREAATYAPFGLTSITWMSTLLPDTSIEGKNSTAQLLFVPDSNSVRKVAELFIKDAACGTSRDRLSYFSQQYFPRPAGTWNLCRNYSSCVSTAACWQPVMTHSLTFAASEEEAVDLVQQQPDWFDALVVFDPDSGLSRYKLRLSQDVVVDPRQLQDHTYQPAWSDYWGHSKFRYYWWFANMQHGLDKAVLAFQHGAQQPINIRVSIKPYPDGDVSLDVTGASLANIVQLTLMIAYLIPFRFAITSVVQEKELQLGEGLYIMGLSHAMYWASWACSHFIVVASSGTLVTIVLLGLFQPSAFFINLIFFWLLAAALVPFAYCISTLFRNTKQATYWSVLIYGASLAPARLAYTLQPYGGPSWTLACLFPPSALLMFTSGVSTMEMDAIPITWETLSNPIMFGHAFSLSTVFLMLLLGAVLYPLLVWYLDKVMPGSPQRQPAWFLLTRAYWKRIWMEHKSQGEQARGGEEEGLLTGRGEETMQPAVRIVNLMKSFTGSDGGQTLAVDELCVELQDKRITAMLGHNGAGKTTTINILTGLLSPSSGSAYIHGLDIRTDMESIRESMGICPQFDVLWPNLSVREHLQLYAAIKGFNPQDASFEAERAAASVDLISKLDTWAGELSGGQRRKLSVAIAFMGSPRIVFLDEPTSGMDAYTRRFTWDLIRQHRSNAAIVLTTHSMEEADLLSDDITIMASGRLVAQGTPLQLKNQYGVGYTLTISLVTTHHADLAGIQQLIGRHVSNSGGPITAGSEVSMKLPTSQAPCFPALLRDLESSKASLGVDSYGLSMTTMEEVFLSVTHGAQLVHRPQQNGTSSSAQAAPSPNGSSPETSLPIPPPPLPSPPAPASFLSQFFALLTRRAHSARRSIIRLTFSQLLFPQIFLFLGLYLSRSEWSLDRTMPAAPITHSRCLGNYPTGFVLTPPVISDPHALSLQRCYEKATLLPARNESALDQLLMRPVSHGRHINDVLLLQEPLPAPQVLLNGTLGMHIVIAFNNSLVQSVPGALNAFARALQCYLQRDESSGESRGVVTGGAYGGENKTERTGLAGGQMQVEETEAVPGGRGNNPDKAEIQQSEIPSPLQDGMDIESVKTASRALHTWNRPFLNLLRTQNESVVSPHYAPRSTLQAFAGKDRPQEENFDTFDALSEAFPQQTESSTRLPPGPHASLPPPISILDAPLPPPLPSDSSAQQVLSRANMITAVACIALFAAHTTSMCVTYLLQEVSSGSKHMLIVSGASPGVLILSQYMWDLLQLLVTAGVGVGVIAGAGFPQLSGSFLAAAALELAVLCCAGLALVYVMQYAVKDEARAMGRLYQTFFFFPFFSALVIWSLGPIHIPWEKWGVALNLVIWGCKIIFPHYHLLIGVMHIMDAYDPSDSSAVLTHHIPSTIQQLHWQMLTTSSLSPSSLTPPIHDPHYMGALSPTLSPHATSTLQSSFPISNNVLTQTTSSPFSDSAFKTPITWMLVQAAVYLSLMLLIETDIFRPLRAKLHALSPSTTHSATSRPTDTDVEAEDERVRSGAADDSQVLINGVHKSYWLGVCSFPVSAVRGLSVGIQGGACFGLLGLNGAGKTTTFKMLTGEILPNAGDVTVGGASVVKRPEAVRKLLGYAAQGGGLPKGLTGREVLDLFARLRGIPRNELPFTVSALIDCLGLHKYADKLWETYSGGNKKKLAVAAALIGGPPVVLLDEPSTGMDPAARRFMWTVLQEQVLASGRTVVLTSHSMEECDALCTRIGIMAEGKLGCLGSSQHLKNRFGMGYRLEVHVQSEEAVQKVVSHVRGSFPAAKMEVEGTRVVCSIPREGLDLPGLFEAVQLHQEEWEVLDYCISQTTLEQVFLALAGAGQPGGAAGQS